MCKTAATMILSCKSLLTRKQLQRFYSTTKPCSGILHHEWIMEGNVVPNVKETKQETVLFLHGLLGSGKNLRNPAKRLTQAFPNISALLLDLRGHGNSHFRIENTAQDSSSKSSHTIQTCTMDIIETMQALKLTGALHSPIGIVGHSFGGRCALQYTYQLLVKNTRNTSVHPPKHTWLLDTVPGNAHGGVAKVVNAISSVPMPVKSRKELVRILTEEKGLDLSIASWMTTNLKQCETGDGFEFIFDLDVARSVKDDFPNQDFMAILQDCLVQAQGKNKMHLVMAGKNSAWSNEIIKELKEVQSASVDNSALELVSLPKADHWVHVDDLDGLMEAIERSFRSP